MRFDQTVPFIIPSLIALLAINPDSIATCIAVIGVCGLIGALKYVEGHRESDLQKIRAEFGIIREELRPIKERVDQLTVKSFNR